MNNLNLPRILLANDSAPSANRIRSPAFASRSSTSCSFFSGFRLDTSGPIPSSSPLSITLRKGRPLAPALEASV
uniref:GSVIVT01037036001 n=1 Tax=Arundo donax TaxID=35708 RepID=A0A0A9DJ10_ARUDO